MSRPFWPLVDYAVNYDFIVENFCVNKDKPKLQCNGQCYLMKMLAEKDEKKANPFEGHKSKTEQLEIVYLESLSYPDFVVIDQFNLQEQFYAAKSFLSVTCSIQLPPPKVVLV